MSKLFDRRLGPDFLASVPMTPGVYRMLDEAGNVVYVGKAKSLRRRLSQYRNAKRRKKHLKMRAIVGTATRVEITPTATELDAELLEARLIRELRPRWNVVGAFSFLYPMMGLGVGARGELLVGYTTTPSERTELTWHGAFRSREITGDAFFALVRLLSRIGHLSRGVARPRGARTYVFSIRKLPLTARASWARFFDGDSRAALDALVLALLERAAARRDAKDVQRDLEALERFHRHEALTLRRARMATGYAGSHVPQAERDELFIRARRARPQRAA